MGCLREDIAELFISKLGFEGRIGICQRDREGQGNPGCRISMSKGSTKFPGGNLIHNRVRQRQTPSDFLFISTIRLSFLLEFSVSGPTVNGYFLAHGRIGKLSLSFAFSCLSDSP